MAPSASACRRRIREARRVAKPSRMMSAPPTTASVTASRFSSAVSLRSCMDPVVSSTTTAPTMSSPTKMGCAAERIATSRFTVPRHSRDETPINARSSCPGAAGWITSPTGTRGVGTMSEAMGASHVVSGRVFGSVRASVPESPRTRMRLSTTMIRDARRPTMVRSRSISSEGRYAVPRLAAASGSAAAKSAMMRRRSSASRSAGSSLARKSCGRSESAAAMARVVAPMACSCESRRNDSMLEMNFAASHGSASSTSATVASRKRMPCRNRVSTRR